MIDALSSLSQIESESEADSEKESLRPLAQFLVRLSFFPLDLLLFECLFFCLTSLDLSDSKPDPIGK